MSRKLVNAAGEKFDIPDDEVDAAIADGLRPATTRMVGPSGDAFDIPDDEVESAAADGLKPAVVEAGAVPVPQDVQDAGAEVAQGVAEEAPGWGEAALAGVQGVTRYLGGDVIREAGNRAEKFVQGDVLGIKPENQLDMFQDRDEVLANKKASPTAATVGETVGLVGSAFVPTSGIAKVLPAVGVNAAGAAIGAKVAAKLAPQSAGLVRAAISKVAGIAAQGAAENVLQSAAGEVNEAFLRGDYTQLAEKLPARMWDDAQTGALWSVGTAGALKLGKLGIKAVGGLGKAANKAGDYLGDVAETRARNGVTRAEQDLAEALDTEARQVVEARAAQLADDAALDAERVTVQTADDVVTSMDSRAAQLARREDNRVLTLTEKAAGDIQYRDAIKDATKAIKRDQDELLSISEYFDENANRSSKQFQNRELNAWGSRIADPYVQQVVDEIGVGAREMLEGHGAIAHQLGGGTAALKRAGDLSSAFGDAIKKDLAAGNAGDAYNKADDLKLLLGKLKNSKDAAVAKFAEDHYEKMRVLLEDEERFGSLAVRQRVFNAALSKQISASQADGIGGLFIDTGRKNASNSWLNAEGTNDEAVQALLGKLGTGVTYQEDAYRGFLGALDGSLSARAEALQNPQLLEKATRARQLSRNIANQMDNVSRLRRGADEWAAARAAAELTPTIQIAGFGIDGKAALKAAHGTALVRLRSAEAAVSAGRVARETAAQRAARDLEQAQKKITSAAENGRLWREAGSMARGVGAAGGALSRGAGQVGKALDSSADKIRRAAVLNSVKEADELSDPESDKSKDLQSRLETMRDTLGPDLTSAYAVQLQRRNAFLRDKAGPMPSASMFGGAPKRVVDDETADRLSRYMDAADDPTAALKRIGDGAGTAEDAETVATLFPSMWGEFRQKVVSKLAAQKDELPYDSQLAIAQALRLPLTPEQQPEAAAFWQGRARTQAAQAPAKSRAPKLNGQGFTSKGDRIG